MKSILSKKLIFSLFVFLVFPFFVNAQSLELRSSPTYPEVGDSISATVSSFDIDVNKSEISWYKDGKFERKGVGMKNFSFAVGPTGNTIKVSVKTNSSTFEQSIKMKLNRNL